LKRVVDILGGGIGGLTSAIALEKKGFDVRVWEQSEQLLPLGAGIILANNAMQVYDKLDLRDALELKGNVISSMKITDSSLNKVSEVDLKFFEKKYGVKNLAIHRGDLQKTLVNNLG